MTQTPDPAATAHRPVLVVDFGAQYAQLIARRVREANVYSEIVPHTASVADLLAKDPAAIILSGGPSSVYATGAPFVDPALFEAGVPVLGICYGFQAMAAALGGTVAQTGQREYGGTAVEVTSAGTVLSGSPASQTVWMSHGDAVHAAPEGFEVLATSSGSPVAAFEDRDRRLFGVQWHPEVKHSPLGQKALENFLYEGAGLTPDWNAGNVVAEQVEKIRAQVGLARVICGLSGGVDSSGTPNPVIGAWIAYAHGWVYVVYLVTVFDLWSKMRWRIGRLATMAAAGVVPVMSFVLERTVHAQSLARIEAAGGARG